MRKLQYLAAKLFNFPIDPKRDERVLSMVKKISDLDGLQFSITVGGQGWMAECKNLEGIATGGKDLSPPPLKIDRAVKDAIFAAFGIPPHLCDDRMIKSPFELEEQSSIEHIDIVYYPQLKFG